MGLVPGLVGWSADISGTAASPLYIAAGILLLSVPLFLGLNTMARAR